MILSVSHIGLVWIWMIIAQLLVDAAVRRDSVIFDPCRWRI